VAEVKYRYLIRGVVEAVYGDQAATDRVTDTLTELETDSDWGRWPARCATSWTATGHRPWPAACTRSTPRS
jgi:hypothetical protein